MRYSSRSSLLVSETLQGGFEIRMCLAARMEPHSHSVNVIKPILTTFDLKRLPPVGSQFSCAMRFWGSDIPSGFEVSSLMHDFRGEGS